MLDLGGISSILEVRANGTLELRDMLLKNVATEKDLSADFTFIRSDFARVSGTDACVFQLYARYASSLQVAIWAWSRPDSSSQVCSVQLLLGLGQVTILHCLKARGTALLLVQVA